MHDASGVGHWLSSRAPVMWCVVDCLSPNCSGRGVCVGGECLCYGGYHGADCSLSSDSVVCVPDCSRHGLLESDKQTCVCQSGWTGHNCETGWSTSAIYTCHHAIIFIIVQRASLPLDSVWAAEFYFVIFIVVITYKFFLVVFICFCTFLFDFSVCFRYVINVVFSLLYAELIQCIL